MLQPPDASCQKLLLMSATPHSFVTRRATGARVLAAVCSAATVAQGRAVGKLLCCPALDRRVRSACAQVRLGTAPKVSVHPSPLFDVRALPGVCAEQKAVCLCRCGLACRRTGNACPCAFPFAPCRAEVLWVSMTPVLYAAVCVWVVASLGSSGRELLSLRASRYELKGA